MEPPTGPELDIEHEVLSNTWNDQHRPHAWMGGVQYPTFGPRTAEGPCKYKHYNIMDTTLYTAMMRAGDSVARAEWAGVLEFVRNREQLHSRTLARDQLLRIFRGPLADFALAEYLAASNEHYERLPEASCTRARSIVRAEFTRQRTTGRASAVP